MEGTREREVERSPCLVKMGWFAFVILYLLQAGLFFAFWLAHLNRALSPVSVILFVPALVRICCMRFADQDKNIRQIWIAWGLYIVAYVITVAAMFGTFAHKLTKDEVLGINALMGTLCITPALLILLLHLMISPAYQKRIFPLSIFAALDIFDGIKMLEIFLMQKGADFDLNSNTEICIIVFACLCFFLSLFGLARNKFMTDGLVKVRKQTSVFFVQLEIIGINLPFLVLRAVVWQKYETAIIMAKKIFCMVIGGVEFLILIGQCKCQGNSRHNV
jgi:hypothetical protein